MMPLLQGFASSPAQSLRVLQPTSSTVSYTVTTRPAARTISAVLCFYIGLLVRILVGIVIGLALWTKWRVVSGKSTTALLYIPSSAGVEWFLSAVESMQWRYLAPGTLLALSLALRRGYTEESLTVLRGLGVQTSTASSMYLRTATTRFIPATSIQDVFIHEAFKGFEVRFYLAIVVKGEEKVVVVFPTLLPRRAILEQVWRGARACLYEGIETSRMSKE